MECAGNKEGKTALEGWKDEEVAQQRWSGNRWTNGPVTDHNWPYFPSTVKLNIANPATGAQKLIDLEDERRS
jgi:hypothetical protein